MKKEVEDDVMYLETGGCGRGVILEKRRVRTRDVLDKCGVRTRIYT